MVCTNRTDTATEVQAWVGQPCPDCGHTWLVHGGPANPGLELCVTCELLAATAELRATVGAVQAALDKLGTWKAKAQSALQALDDRVTALESKP